MTSAITPIDVQTIVHVADDQTGTTSCLMTRRTTLAGSCPCDPCNHQNVGHSSNASVSHLVGLAAVLLCLRVALHHAVVSEVDAVAGQLHAVHAALDEELHGV